MRRLAIASFLALTGCATTLAPKIVTRDVFIPTPQRCVDPAKIPNEPAETVLSIDARQAADQASRQAKLLRAWGRELRALIVPACTKENSK